MHWDGKLNKDHSKYSHVGCDGVQYNNVSLNLLFV